ncbi:toprim domain-containing protein [Candidatus Bathyarchaeota archaeon]|nr:toprim domain-containing protein [Candidatus Bathyarchaeota archaeon]
MVEKEKYWVHTKYDVLVREKRIMSSLERKIEKINCLIEDLKGETFTGALLIVEGERDIEALKAIGIESNILAVKSHGKSLQDIIDKIESIGDREIILLMDFDEHGRELTERLARNLERSKVKLNIEFWRKLCSLLGNDLKDVEGLATYIENLKRKARL